MEERTGPRKKKKKRERRSRKIKWIKKFERDGT